MRARQKIAKIIGIFLVIPMIIFAAWGINEAAKMRLVYRTTFINNAIIAIPEDIYSTIKSSEMILRVNKRSEYKTYTTSVIIDGRNFTNTITTYRGGLIRSDGISSVFNADIPKAKAFQISVSPSSQNPFTLEVYDKRW